MLLLALSVLLSVLLRVIMLRVLGTRSTLLRMLCRLEMGIDVERLLLLALAPLRCVAGLDCDAGLR
jgi:hypothetical protein